MSFIYNVDANIVVPPCCQTIHIVPAFVRCAGANYEPSAAKTPPPTVTCSACGTVVEVDKLMRIGTLPKQKPPAPSGWENMEVPDFLRADGESSRQFHERTSDTRTATERAKDEPLPPEFIKLA